MTRILLAISLAAVILGAALLATTQGLTDGASFGMIAGLSGAAWGMLHSDLGCGRRCLS